MGRWLHDSTEDSCYGLTLFGLENVQKILSDELALLFIKGRTEYGSSKSEDTLAAMVLPRAAG